MRWLLVALLVSLMGFGATATLATTSRLADALGSAVGRALGDAVARTESGPPPVMIAAEPMDEAVEPPSAAEPGLRHAVRAGAGRSHGGRSHAVPAHGGRGNPRGILVRERSVLALAQRGASPGAVFVPARGARPSGLALRGVSALGLGLQDGDVLTHVAGQRVAAVGDVVALVLAARGRRAPVIGGRVWRGSEPFQLSVEQPYPGAEAHGAGGKRGHRAGKGFRRARKGTNKAENPAGLTRREAGSTLNAHDS